MTRSKQLSVLARNRYINVTPEIIAHAIQRDSSSCVVADAIKASLPEAKFVSVDLATVRFTDPSVNKRFVYLTPAAAQRAVIAFDQGEQIEPFSFRLTNPAQIHKAGVPRPGDQARKRAKPNGNGGVPTLIDGPPLPRGPLPRLQKGRIRAFGLRQLSA